MTVYIHDDAGTFSSADIVALQGEAGRWPFSLHVLTHNTASKAELANLVHQCVTGPDVVCVGLDPAGHRTETHFGTGTGVRPQDFNAIAAAGNASFKAGNWRGGIESIADQAKASSQTTAAVVVVQQPAPVETSSSVIVRTGLALVVAAIGATLWYLFKPYKSKAETKEKRELKATVEDLKAEAEQYRARNIEEQEWHDKFKATVAPNTTKLDARAVRYSDRFDKGGVRIVAPVTPAPVYVAPRPTPVAAPVIVNQSSDVSNLVAGYALGRIDATPTRERVIERVVEREESPRSLYSSSSSSDSGGSSSSWDYGSSSSWDSGGSSSSFDSGGGGFDSGGGGGDF